MTETVLVGDIGGTNARFGLAQAGPNGPQVSGIREFVDADYARAEDAIRA